MRGPPARTHMARMAHAHRSRVWSPSPTSRVALARQLRTCAVILLVAYGIVCLVLAFTDAVPAAFIGLGLVALAAAWAGTRAPGPTGVLLVLAGAVIGPVTALVARAAGGTYAAAAADRLLVLVFAVPVAAGIVLLLSTRLGARESVSDR